MKQILLSLLMIPMISFAQITIDLQPHYDDGNNTYVRSGTPTTPCVGAADMTAYAWTCSGDLCIGRGLFTFDMENVPAGSEIVSATLYLYANTSTAIGFGGAEPQTGTNAAHIYRVTEDWDYATVTWTTQPDISMVNAVAMDESTDPVEDYVSDVTALIQDWVNDPENTFGLTIRLDDEVNYYTSLIFCSSFHLDESLHPKLSVTYIAPVGVEEIAAPQFSVAPNPSNSSCTIYFENAVTQEQIGIYDITGKLMQWVQVPAGSNSVECSTVELPSGLYFIHSANSGSDKLQVNH